MPSKVAIKVFNIGKTVVDRDEVQRWLDFMGVQEFMLPDDDGPVTNPALLVALAAKRCYKSFEPGLNPNVTRVRSDYAEYLDNVMKVGHGSVLEHSVFNFAIENVSRVFTAEMNRHRAGWAISEGSLRFIRFGEDIPYWEPTSITGPDLGDLSQVRSMIGDLGAQASNRGGQKKLGSHMMVDAARSNGLNDILLDNPLELRKQLSREVFQTAFGNQEYWYRVLEVIWDMDETDKNFAYKKVVTSMMRRIVGLGVATGGVWSGNIRALRHVLTMRCEPAAEEEILMVFSEICQRMAKQEPMLFGDFKQDDNGFWRPQYRKV